MREAPPPAKTHEEFNWHSRALTIISNPEPPIAPPALAHAIAIMASGFIVRDTRTGEVVVTRVGMCGARFTRRMPLLLAASATQALGDDYRVEPL